MVTKGLLGNFYLLHMYDDARKKILKFESVKLEVLFQSEK